MQNFSGGATCNRYWYGTNDSILDLVIDNKQNIFNDIVVEPGQLMFNDFIDIKTSLTSDSSFFDNNFFSLSDFRFVQAFRGNSSIPKGLYFQDEKKRFWNGKIIFSVLKNEFEYKCRVNEDDMKLNGIKFKKE